MRSYIGAQVVYSDSPWDVIGQDAGRLTLRTFNREHTVTVDSALCNVLSRNYGLKCDMERTCHEPVTHIDSKGYVYCRKHGNHRKDTCRCRLLTETERKTLTRGDTITY